MSDRQEKPEAGTVGNDLKRPASSIPSECLLLVHLQRELGRGVFRETQRISAGGLGNFTVEDQPIY